MASSVAKVLGTYELLQHILLYLAIKDLFLVQTIASQWHGIIKRSESIRRNMFLLPDGEARRPSRSEHKIGYYTVVGPGYLDTVKLNPVVPFRCDSPHRRVGSSRTVSPAIFQLVADGKYTREGLMCVDMTLSPRQDRTDMSFCDMFISQPPITAVAFRVNENPMRFGTIMCTVYRPAGLRIRDLYEAHADVSATYGYPWARPSGPETWARCPFEFAMRTPQGGMEIP